MNNQNEIILYQPDNTVIIEVLLENETVWLPLDKMAELFQRDKSTISRHIKNVFEEGELNCCKFCNSSNRRKQPVFMTVFC